MLHWIIFIVGQFIFLLNCVNTMQTYSASIQNKRPHDIDAIAIQRSLNSYNMHVIDNSDQMILIISVLSTSFDTKSKFYCSYL